MAPQFINYECNHKVCTFAHWLSAHRRGAHGAVQLAVRAAPRRHVPAAHRGHRPAALDRGGDRGDLRRPGLARAERRRAAGVPVRSGRSGTPRWRASCWPRARPTTATPRRRSWRRCARRSAPRAGPMRYDGRWRDRDPAEAPPGVPPVIRLKAPQTGETVIEDLVQGEVQGRQRAARRHGAAARRRHADLHALGRGRRSRHGDHPRDPRRRSPRPTPSARSSSIGARLAAADRSRTSR